MKRGFSISKHSRLRFERTSMKPVLKLTHRSFLWGRLPLFQSSSGMKFRDVAGDSRTAAMFACASSVSRQDFCEVPWDMITNIVVIKTCEHFVSKFFNITSERCFMVGRCLLINLENRRHSPPKTFLSNFMMFYLFLWSVQNSFYATISFSHCWTISQKHRCLSASVTCPIHHAVIFSPPSFSSTK